MPPPPGCSGRFILIMAVIKLIAPKCKEKIIRSTDVPAWAKLPASGGCTVHPVPAPTIGDARRRNERYKSKTLLIYLWKCYIKGSN